jgi:hypothetical protein
VARKDPIHVATEDIIFLIGKARLLIGRIVSRHRTELTEADAADIERIAASLEQAQARLDDIDRYLRARRGEFIDERG